MKRRHRVQPKPTKLATLAEDTAPVEGQVYQEPSVWTQAIDWTPDRLKEALAEADAGSLMLAADLCDEMAADDRVRGVLATRVNALMGCRIEFECENEAVQKAISTDWRRWTSEAELGRLIRWGCLLGVGLAQVVWQRIDGRDVPTLKVWHPRWLLWNWSRRIWQVQTTTGLVDILPDDPQWVLFLPYGSSRPWAEGTWRALGLYWLGKAFAWKDWNRNNELHGSGIIAGKAPLNAPPETKKKFFAQLQAIARNARIMLPEGFGLDLIEAKSQTWQTFPEAIKVANIAIAIVHLGQNLTTEVDGGSYAATTVHGTVRQDYLEADAEQVSTWAHDGVWTHWAALNYGPGVEAPWARYQTDPPEDLATKADTQLKAASAVKEWVSLGIPVDIRATARQFGVLIDEKAKEPVDVSKGEIFKYHLDYGIFTTNEIRASRGLPPVPGGDVAPKPITGAPADGTEPQTASEQVGLVTLASGERVPQSSGIIEGQHYIDDLTANARDAACKALNPTIDRILGIIEELEDKPGWQDTLKARLAKVASSFEPDQFDSVLEKAFVLAELAGLHSAQEDD